MKKNVIVYWCNFRGKEENTLSFLGSKKKVYLDVFDEISKKANLALVFGSSNYLGELIFKNHYLYKNGIFVKEPQEIQADSVLDRSRSLDFPEPDKLSSKKVTNELAFKKLAIDKWLFYQNFKEYSPETFLINNAEELSLGFQKIKTSLGVLKPRLGLKGKDIFFLKKEELNSSKINFPILLQEFVETKGFWDQENRHDIRVVIINGKPVYSVIRKPVSSKYLANVAQGGSINEVLLSDLPGEVMLMAEDISKKIKLKYNNPFYSIDFGITSSGPIVFEINNFIGFPLIERNHALFVSELSSLLLDKANLKI